jgi:cytochrome c
MLDTMTFTKAGGALCGALLVYMLGGWAAEILYHPKGGEIAQAYSIDTGAAGEEEAETEEVSFEDLMASADADAGSKLWRQCSACHSNEADKHGTGPSLHAIVGRDKAAIDGFRYSGAMAAAEGAWEAENLYAFIANPRGYIAGTSMAYAGMRKSEDRANLIAYLATFN